MLYKVTPAMDPQPSAKAKTPGHARPRRKSAVYDSEGHEVLVTLMCLKCKKMKPLVQFGLRKMADGAIRNQPWCRGCRSAATPKKARVGEGAGSLSEVSSGEGHVHAPVGESSPMAAESAPALGLEGAAAP